VFQATNQRRSAEHQNNTKVSSVTNRISTTNPVAPIVTNRVLVNPHFRGHGSVGTYYTKFSCFYNMWMMKHHNNRKQIADQRRQGKRQGQYTVSDVTFATCIQKTY